MKITKREDIDRDSLSRLCNLLSKHKAKLKEAGDTKSSQEVKSLRQKISSLKCSIEQVKDRLKKNEVAISDRVLPDIRESRHRGTGIRSKIFGHNVSVRGAYDRDYNYPGCTE